MVKSSTHTSRSIRSMMSSQQINSIDTEELLDVLNSMGYSINSDDLSRLKCELERFIEDDKHEGDADFGDISCSPSSFEIASNAALSQHGLNLPNRYDKNIGETPELGTHYISGMLSPVHRNAGRMDSGKDMNDDDDFTVEEVSDLIYDGYCCFQRLRCQSSRLSETLRRMESQLNECQKRSNFVQVKADSCQKCNPTSPEICFSKSPTLQNNEHLELVSTDRLQGASYVSPAKVQPKIDSSIRPILHPVPGGLPFRHDPVKKYELYRKEWTKNPPPGENKRLSLRWKIREFMLRQYISCVKPADLLKARPANPNWVPARYL